MFKILILLQVLQQIIFVTPTPGTAITCLSQGGSTTCSNSCPSAPTGCQWIGSSLTSCQIQDCSQCSNSIVQYSDLYCQSCTSKKFANQAKNGCVNSVNTCDSTRTVNTWTNSDCAACYSTGYISNGNNSACINCKATSGLTDVICNLCATANGNQNKFANAGANQCVSSTSTCSSSRALNSWSNSDCQQCYGSTYISFSSNSQCIDCSSPSGLTDEICSQCATVNSTQTQFANKAGTSCVNSSSTCGSSRTVNTWSNSDCVACFGTGYVVSSNFSTCINCKATQSLTDSICKFCAAANNNSNNYANNQGTACVNSSSTCGTGRAIKSWTDADCLLCSPATPIAKEGGESCGVSSSYFLAFGNLMLLLSLII